MADPGIMTAWVIILYLDQNTLTQPMMEPPKVHCITAFDVMWRHLNVRILCILEISIFSVALDVLCNILSGSIPLDVDKNNSASIETHPEHH